MVTMMSEPGSHELFSVNYEMNFSDDYGGKVGSAANPVSPRSASKFRISSGQATRSPAQGSTAIYHANQSADSQLQSPASVENNSLAIRMRSYNFPYDMRTESEDSAEQDLRRRKSVGKLGHGSRVISRSSQNSNYTTSPSYPNSTTSSPRRSTRSGTVSSVSSLSNYTPLHKGGFTGFLVDEQKDHIQRENESEKLFNQLRSFRIGSVAGADTTSESYNEDVESLKSEFLARSRKSSVECPTVQLQGLKKRQSMSQMSEEPHLSGSITPNSQASPRSTSHKRASAIIDAQDVVPTTYSFSVPSSPETYKKQFSDQFSHRSHSLHEGSDKSTRKHSTVASPALTIQNTKEQIRRNSSGKFSNFYQFAKQNNIDHTSSVFASLPETGDHTSDALINLDFVNKFKLQKPPKAKKYKPHFDQRLSTSISEESFSSESLSTQDDELLTLMDFLRSD